ncbi:MAG: hypothetical protein R6V23_13780 [Bacteroidales bacterium]
MNYRIVIIYCFLLIFANQKILSKEKKDNDYLNSDLSLKSNPYNSLGLHLISFSAGAAGWYNSLQQGMENQKFPVAINIGYTRSESPFGLIVGANILSTYVLDDFLLKPNYFSLALAYQPFKNINTTNTIRFYTFAGLNMSYSKFTEQEYSDVINYNYKVEKQFGFGVHLGTSLMYKINQFEIGPSFVYNTGKADFLAGYFTKQTFNTGSLQLNIILKYSIVFDRNKNACPAYRNFQRFEL